MFKLDNGAELFSSQDMQRLRKAAGGAMGSRPWVEGFGGEATHASGCSGDGTCSCKVKCARCRCAMRAAGKKEEAGEVTHGSSGE